jgi:hypothetical protein
MSTTKNILKKYIFVSDVFDFLGTFTASCVWLGGLHVLRGPRPQDAGHLRFGYCFDSKVGPGPPSY